MRADCSTLLTDMTSTMIWILLLYLTLFSKDTEAHSANTIGNILKRLSDCQFNSIKVQTGDIKTSKAVMKNGLYLGLNTVNTTLLTLHDNLSFLDESYFSQFKLCQNVLVTNTATEKLMDPLSKSNISVNAGIFRYTLDKFGNVTEWIEFYKTKGISNTLQIKSKSQLDEKYVWKRRSNLFGVDFNAISS